MQKYKSKIQKRGVEGVVWQAVIYIFMAVVVFFVVLPVVLTIIISLKTKVEFQQSFWQLPQTPMWSNYAYGLSGIWNNMLNSIVIYLIITFGAVALSSFAAYVFVRHKFPGREFLFMLIVALQIVPGVLTLTPTYLTVINLHLDNTWWALILPGIAGQQIGNIFIFRTFMANHPKEIYESAQLDGANEFVLYSKLCIPLSIPILTIQLIGIFASMYNDYMWPYLVIERKDISPLMPILKSLAANLADQSGEPGVSYAVYLVAGIPLIFTTAFGLRFFINGDFAAAVKL